MPTDVPTPTPKIAAIVPCFNHGRFVAEAVRSCLAQLESDLFVVIVDDGSTDGTTPEACARLASDLVRIVHQPNSGPAIARNRGVREAARWVQPEFLIFLDADDLLEPCFARDLVGAINADPDQASVSHAYCQERLTELGTGIWHVPAWDPLLLLITNLHPVTALVRRSHFEAVGGFDETIPGYEDWDLWIRMSERGFRGVRVREPLFVWRRHSHSTRVFTDIARHDELYKAIIERHRPLFDRHAIDLIARSNEMLRTFDANWIDETGFPKPLQYLWKIRDEIVPELHLQLAGARSQAEQASAALRHSINSEAATKAWYESFAAVRFYRAWRRLVDRLPRPLSAGANASMRAAKSFLPAGRAAAPTPTAPPTP